MYEIFKQYVFKIIIHQEVVLLTHISPVQMVWNQMLITDAWSMKWDCSILHWNMDYQRVDQTKFLETMAHYRKEKSLQGMPAFSKTEKVELLVGPQPEIKQVVA